MTDLSQISETFEILKPILEKVLNGIRISLEEARDFMNITGNTTFNQYIVYYRLDNVYSCVDIGYVDKEVYIYPSKQNGGMNKIDNQWVSELLLILTESRINYYTGLLQRINTYLSESYNV